MKHLCKFATVCLTVFQFTMHAYSASLLDVNFEGQTADSQPTGTAYLRPTANSTTQAVQVVNKTLLGGNQAVQYLDRAVNTATSSSLQYNFASNGAVVCSFSFSPSYVSGTSANYLSAGLGRQVTLSSAADLFCEARLRADGSVVFYSAGTSVGSVTGLAAGSSNTISMFVNDTDAAIVYAGGTLAANTVDYYFNGSLVYAGASFGATIGGLGTTNGPGRVAFFDSSARFDLDYLIDNIAVSGILPPANVSAMASMPTGSGTGTGGLTVGEGSSITLTETPSAGTVPFTYAWKKVGAGDVLGTNSTLLISSPTNGAQYICDVAATWDGVTNTSPTATLSVLPLVSATAAAPTGNGSGTGGMTAYAQRTRMTLTETPSGGTPPFSYAWKKVGSGTVLGTNSTLTISPLVNGDQYACDVASTADGVTNTSPVVTLTVTTVIDPNKVAIIKADDFRAVNWNWQSWTNFLVASRDLGIKVSPGAVVTNMSGNASIAQWMQAQEAVGDVEFWNHGWDHSQWVDNSVTNYEFSGSGLVFQQTHLTDSQEYLHSALGRDVIAFGTPYNQFDTNTTALINNTSALRLFFTTSINNARTRGLDARVAAMKIISETGGTGMPDAAIFEATYPNGPTEAVALQFHPADPNFNTNRVDEYAQIVQHLLTNGYAFLTPSEYVASLPVYASFSASPTNGGAPLIVTFTDNSLGSPTNRYWSFGDGATMNVTTTSLTHTYSFPSTSTVRLIVRDANGSSTNTKAGLIVAASVDTVGDGVPDWWRAQYFNGNGTTTNADSSATADFDNDGISNFSEYLADTNPTNVASRLEVTGLTIEANGVHLTWTGGSSAWQFVEYRNSLTDTNGWRAVYTNTPPTAVTNILFDAGAGNSTSRFYRIKAWR